MQGASPPFPSHRRIGFFARQRSPSIAHVELICMVIGWWCRHPGQKECPWNDPHGLDPGASAYSLWSGLRGCHLYNSALSAKKFISRKIVYSIIHPPAHSPSLRIVGLANDWRGISANLMASNCLPFTPIRFSNRSLVLEKISPCIES